MNLRVSIEILGHNVHAGNITGEADDARFSYAESYLDNQYKPISVSLPLQEEEGILCATELTERIVYNNTLCYNATK